MRQRSFDHRLGFRPRVEDRRAQREAVRPEVAAAENARDRLAPEAAFDQRGDRGSGFGRERLAPAPREFGPRAAARVGDQKLGIEPRRRQTGRGECALGGSDRVGDRDRRAGRGRRRLSHRH